MEIVILVFFIAIFGGILFLLGLVWFIFRRIKKSRSSSRNFAGGSTNYAGGHHQPHQSFTDSDDDAGAIYAGNSLFANQEPESAPVTETAHDSPFQSGDSSAHESRGEYGAPADT